MGITVAEICRKVCRNYRKKYSSLVSGFSYVIYIFNDRQLIENIASRISKRLVRLRKIPDYGWVCYIDGRAVKHLTLDTFPYLVIYYICLIAF